MALNRKRLFIVAGICSLAVVSATAVYGLRFRGSQKASTLEQSARAFLAKEDYASARIELDKLLLLKPNDAGVLFLKAQSLLEKRDPARIRASDGHGLNAIRFLIQATRRDPELTEAHRLLVGYFLGSGDLGEAANHARAVLRTNSNDLVARHALAASLVERKQPEEATEHVQFLVNAEKPITPKTVWLVAQMADLTGRRGEWNQQAKEAIDQLKNEPPITFHEIRPQECVIVIKTDGKSTDDQLAIAQLHAWLALRDNDPDAAKAFFKCAIGNVRDVAKSSKANDTHPRWLLQAAQGLIPENQNQTGRAVAAIRELTPDVEGLIDSIYAQAVTDQVIDPSIYVRYADRLRKANKTEEAVKVVESGIATAKNASPEVRLSFAPCDLWLAEYFLGNRQPEAATIHIDALLANQQWQAWGKMLRGYQLIQAEKFDEAADSLREAVGVLGEHGVCNVLYGLCQLRRGFLSESRQYLEKGVRLGADGPQYKAWLALSLSEAGYQDEAMTMAQQVLNDPRMNSLGRTLLGQLRLRAGQYDAARKDFETALQTAAPETKPALYFSMAELAAITGDWPTAAKIITELKKTPLAPRAYLLEFNHLQRQQEETAADKVLAEARTKFPEDHLLLAAEIRNLVRQSKFDESIAVLEKARQLQPKALAPTLLLADVYERAEKVDQAVHLLQETRTAFPEQTSVAVRLAEQLITLKRFDDANKILADLKGNPKVNPTTVEFLLARAASMQGDPAKAKKILEQAADKDPDNPTLKYLLGQLAVQNGDYKKATQLLTQSLASGIQTERSLDGLFETCVRTGDLEKARQLLVQAEKRGQDVRQWRGRLLRLLSARELREPIDEELKLFLSPKASEADYALGVWVLRSINETDRASKLLNEASEKFPDSALLGEHQVMLLLEQKKFSDAEWTLDKLLAKRPDSPVLHVLKVQSLIQTEHLAAAEKAAATGWQQCPGNAAIAAVRVQTLLRNAKDAEAAAFAAEAKQKHADLPAPNYLVARAYETLQQPRKAVELLEKAVAENPNDARAARHYLKLLIAQGQTAKMEETLKQLLANDPDNRLLLSVEAEYRASRGDIAQTKAALAKLEEIKATGLLMNYLRAVVAFSEGDLPKAEQWLLASLADPRGHSPSAFLLARLRVNQERWEEAITLTKQVVKRRPAFTAARLLEVRLLGRLKRFDEAEAACRDYLASNPTARPFSIMLAQVLVSRGTDASRAEAAKVAVNELAKKPGDPADFEALLRILYDANQKETARKFVEEQAIAAANPDQLLAAARASFAMRDYAESRRLAELALQQRSTDSAARLLLADATVKQGSVNGDASLFRSAADQYRETLKQDPNNRSAANNLAWTVGIHLNDPNKALTELVETIPAAASAGPELPPELLDTVGSLHARLKHWTEAQEFLEAAVSRQPNSAVAHFHLGQLYKEINRSDRAKQCFQKALRLDATGELAKQVNDAMNAN